MIIASATFVKGITGPDPILHDKIPQIAFVGRSNTGKSTLLNSLAGRTLAKTGKKQGKTTEINFFKINGAFYFVDLPGYGFAQGGKETREKIRTMILEYLTKKGDKPRAIALIVDSKVGLTDFDRDMLDILSEEGHRIVVILNKTDKLTQKELAAAEASVKTAFPAAAVLPYSSKTKKGTNLVLETLLARK